MLLDTALLVVVECVGCDAGSWGITSESSRVACRSWWAGNLQ